MFGRVLTAMVTPFDRQMGVDLDRAVELAKRLVAQGTEGIVATGTTGEAATLTVDEKVALWQALKQGQPAQVIAGVGLSDTRATVDLALRAQAAGVDGLLVVNPPYNKPNQEGLYRHFMAVAEAVDIPVILYNHPFRTGVNLEVATLARLVDHPRIVGVKDSSLNLELITRYGALVRDGFALYSGDDPLTLPTMAVGGFGVVSVTSHVAGPQIKAMVDAVLNQQWDQARLLNARLMDLHKALFVSPSPGPVKAALAMLDFPVGSVRLPLVEPGDEERAHIRQALRVLG